MLYKTASSKTTDWDFSATLLDYFDFISGEGILLLKHLNEEIKERSKREDVFFAEVAMSIREKKRVRFRQSIRTVPISTRLREALCDWFKHHPGGPYTFQAGEHIRNSNKTREIGMGITRDEIQNYFKRTLAKSEWAELPGWHVLRHSFISNCAAKGIDQRTIMSWVGHMTAEMQERYRHLVPSRMQQELNSVFG